MPAKTYREVSVNLTWQAVYGDHTVNQYNGDGSQNSYGELKREGLTEFRLVDGKGEAVVTVPLDESRSLFFRSRVAMYPGSRTRERFWIAGWQKSDGSKHIWVVDSAGAVKSHRKWVENSQWLYPIEPFPFEVV